MKTINCDVCGNEIFTASNVIAPRDYWVKLIARYVGKKFDDKNLDLCNLCYMRIFAFIKLLIEKKGNLTSLFMHQNTPLVDKMDEIAQNMLSRHEYYV